MISLTFPWALGMALLGAAGVAVLHLLSVREPPARELPTARFVPEGSSRAVARQPRPSDRRLLLVRVLALLAFGAAFSGMRCHAASRTVVDLVYVAPSLLGDSLQWMPGLRSDASSVSSTRAELVVVPLPDLEEDPGIAIVRALRDATVRATREEALEQVGAAVVVPPTIRSARGWDAWRAQWPAPVRVLIHGEVPQARWGVRVLGGVPDDPVRAAFAVRESSAIEASEHADKATVRVVTIIRDTVSRLRADGSTDLSVLWPTSGIPTGWEPLEQADTVGAITAGGLALIGPFVRRARFSVRLTDSTVRPIVWWGDGEVAAIEREKDGRCVREVAVSIPSATDVLLSPSARGVLDAVGGACGGRVSSRTLIASADSIPEGSRMWRAPASAFRQSMPRDVRSDPWWLAPLLFAFGCLALGAEWWWRRRAAAT